METKARSYQECPFCGNSDGNVMVEYWGGNRILAKYHYDGISEGQCPKCRSRWNRWTLEKLADDEIAYFEKNIKVPEEGRVGLLFRDEAKKEEK